MDRLLGKREGDDFRVLLPRNGAEIKLGLPCKSARASFDGLRMKRLFLRCAPRHDVVVERIEFFLLAAEVLIVVASLAFASRHVRGARLMMQHGIKRQVRRSRRGERWGRIWAGAPWPVRRFSGERKNQGKSDGERGKMAHRTPPARIDRATGHDIRDITRIFPSALLNKI
jgi:hypothetical protein